MLWRVCRNEIAFGSSGVSSREVRATGDWLWTSAPAWEDEQPARIDRAAAFDLRHDATGVQTSLTTPSICWPAGPSRR